MTRPLLIAFPKGRLGDELVPRLAGTPLALDAAALKSRVLRIPTATPGVAALLLKGSDLPRYVAAGVASLGIVGSDTLDELDMDLLELADLGFGACRLSLCTPAGVTLEHLQARPHLRLATKFPRATEAWLAREGLTAELVPLSSSVELAPLLGLADAIVDLVQTGSTLKAHGLVEAAVLGRSSARLVAARGATLSEPGRIKPLAEILIGALK
ncbi:ATP phosphoribosyltransferase [Geothrix rubra]|uniref:ATP phosphoribosyltransferase n=1 Tax=Geothrix rubra TaxID=2927977 RepID=A0ABQ5Q403_9BACT|nr:ATP phosphoribosyltransferase [Geothrix rubra]GLH69214.1 ATP phosphoribosyltransferase [Geothrix rubra]